jgi:nucleoside-diphosphate-sugar epimerase
MNILVTGAAGFIGSHVAEALLARGDSVAGLDNFNDYYDPARKRANAALLTPITCADITKARDLLGYNPTVSVAEGMRHFWEWYHAEILKSQ